MTRFPHRRASRRPWEMRRWSGRSSEGSPSSSGVHFSVGEARLRAALIGARSLAFRLQGPSALGVSCERLDMLAALVGVLRVALRLAESAKGKRGVWAVSVLGDGRSPVEELEEVARGVRLILDLVYALGDAEDAAGSDTEEQHSGKSGSE